MLLGAIYREIRDRFRAAQLATPELDAKLLVSAAANVSVSDLVLKEQDEISDDANLRALCYAEQRLAGKPVGRILGEREFYGRVFRLNDAMLEPRPDTEVLIDAVLRRVTSNRSLRLCDIGTGSGAIAVTLLSELPKSVAVAVDLSEKALAGARLNARLLNVEARFFPVLANYCDALSGGFDLVVSNPPYIRAQVLGELDREVLDYDPRLALDGGEDGLTAYRQIVSRAKDILVSDGRIVLEIGFDQAKDVAGLLDAGGFVAVEIIQDLAGNDRVLTARRSA